MRGIRRRDFITLLGGAAAWPLAARAQQMPVIGVIGLSSSLISEKRMLDFHRGLRESGYVEGQNVVVTYLRAEGQYDRLATLVADLIRRQVAVIVTPNSLASARAAKAATTTIPIVFSATTDPIQSGLVASLARPGGNLTGVFYFTTDLGAKRLGLLRELSPGAAIIAVLVNPDNPTTEPGLQNVQDAARAVGLQLRIFKASSLSEIDAAFDAFARETPAAFMVLNDPFFNDKRTQIVLATARYALPTIYPQREWVDAGGLMSYSASFSEVYHQIGVYTGRILKGAKPADLPVVQPTRFELVINLQAARALRLDIPPTLLARADDIIE